MLEKSTNAVEGIGVIGQICVRTAPVPVPPPEPTSPTTPPPPRPNIPPPAPPQVPPSAPTVSTYQDSFGRCWRVIDWGSGGGLVADVEKIPIDCSEL